MSEQRIEALERRVAKLERLLEQRAAAGQAVTTQPVTADTDTVVDYRSAPPPPPPPPSAAAPQPPVAPRPAVPVAQAGFSLRTSEALLKWAGIGLVVLAVVFALGLAIERGWITPALRVAASSFVAVGLFVAGQRIRASRLVFAETLQGAAFVVAYLTALSMLVMDLVSGNVGFAAMVAVTLAALLAATVLDSPPIAALGILGGFATPLLLQDGIDDPLFLAFYVPLLAVAGWGVYSWTGWRSLANATAIASWALLAVLVIESQATAVGVAVVMVGGLTWLVPLGRTLLDTKRDLSNKPSHFMEEALAPLLGGTTDRLTYAAPLVTLGLLAFVFDLTRYQWSPIVLATAAVFGLAALALAANDFKDRAYVHTTIAALLGAIGITLALNGDVLLVAVALQAVALVFIADRLAHRPMTWQSNVMFGIAVVSVLFRSAERGFDGSVATATWLSELAVLGLATWRAARERDLREYFGAPVHLVALAWLFSVLGDPWVILAVVGLYGAARLAAYLEIVDFEISNPVNAAVIVAMTLVAAAGHYTGEIDYDVGRVLALLTGVVAMAVLAYRLPHQLREAEGAAAYLSLLAWIVAAAGSSDAWITGGWVIVGLAALAWGVKLAHINVQLAGWGTLAVATAKLLLVDLEATDPLVRIGLFFGIGVSFLGLAYLLPTKLAPAAKEPSEEPADLSAAP